MKHFQVELTPGQASYIQNHLPLRHSLQILSGSTNPTEILEGKRKRNAKKDDIYIT